ncbi:histone deacetylase, putative [Candida dubliniensis CD36]|uniref:Histone deacetylase HDA1 n=1 Tax=Candida dubliniensis (strain CD36 / ATCC MYA-646 / CBS 7987 / NCPF 3949 / NRRL Y-17841) TaxID=573826 RepID=B9WL19_CANDC|nr:histone deacetylase, putative [Candida dubliniensis CD36]CAX39722.1 histone deacetylase, putative [Candida dubliniensis CD36]
MSTDKEEHLDSNPENLIPEEEHESQGFSTATEDSTQASFEEVSEVDYETNPIEMEELSEVDDETNPIEMEELSEVDDETNPIEMEELSEVDDETNPIEMEEEVTTTTAGTYDTVHPQEPSTKKIKLEEPETESDSNGIIVNEPQVVVVPPKKPQLFYTPLKTGLVYDVRMRYHAKVFTSYSEYIDPHPEDPRRIYRIYKKLVEAGIVLDPSLAGINEIGPFMLKIPIREATAEEILEVHSEDHLKFIQSTEDMSRDQLLKETETGDSIYVNNDSYLSAKLSCGGTIEACKAVIEGRVKNSLAIVRPPGHHAEPNTPAGFCLFSNVAVAAKNMLKTYPESVRKIVIVDWDIHHGNGTQKAFYNDPRVLYISLHRFENGRFYPGTKYGDSNQVGEGPGEGFTINIPWRSYGMHDGDYVYAFNKIIQPVISEFDPDLIIVSSGFDAADGDVIGACHVTPAGYGYMTHTLKGIARGKLAVILEGGYNLDSISKSALAVAKVLVGEPPENTITLRPHLETIEVVDEVMKIQSKYFKCLREGFPNSIFEDVYDLPDIEKANYKLVNIADPIRSHQVEKLFNEKEFINIPIISSVPNGEKSPFTTDIPDQLEDLVVASPDIYDCTTIILTIHDPPEIWANINPTNGVIETNSTMILEHPLVQIMDKIQKEKDSDNQEKFGYLDINIPSFQLPIPGTTSESSTYNPIIFAQEVLLYIWDNYITYFQQLKNLVLVGFGDSYQAIVNLYGKRPSNEVKDLVKGTVAFLNRTTLKPLIPVMDESMVDWYYQNSVIFTSNFNTCWTGGGTGNGTNGNGSNGGGNKPAESNGHDDFSKRPRKKFGRVIKTTSDGLCDVIQEKFDEGVDFILDSIEDYSSSED